MVTGSWDQTVKLWDPRTPCNAGTFSQPEKVCGGSGIPGNMLNNTARELYVWLESSSCMIVVTSKGDF